jgi:hypothetical protein
MAIHLADPHIKLAIACYVADQPAINRPKLEDLISQCDHQALMPSEDAEWEMLRPVGNELL